jgi:hypothetical protein
MLAKVTRNVAHELRWLDEVTAAIRRDGWDAMKPAFGPENVSSNHKEVIS